MWIWDPSSGAYYDADSQTYAIPSGDDWTYVPAKDFASTSTSTPEVGWGGLMEPEEVEKVKNPAYTSKPETTNEVLRLVVKVSKVLVVGSIAVVDTREGGVQLGRDRCPGVPRIRLKEMQASKTHAVIYWDEGWNVVDLGEHKLSKLTAGSTHGTYVDDSRLSDPKQSSKPQRLKHLSMIKIGSTIFAAHIHGSWPCDQCQLAGANEVQLDDGKQEQEAPQVYAMNSQERRDNREVKRKREMAALREALVGDAPRPPKKTAPAKKPVAPPRSFAESMLANQGWTGGGLGKNSDGRSTPVEVDIRGQRKGLGAVDAIKDGTDWKDRAKQRRYNELRDA